MGALNFAMDTLASLTSALAPPKSIRKGLNLDSLAIKLDDSTRRVVDEFNTGMRMLHKHSVHNTCDVLAITRQNMKLLHTNLKADSTYRRTISLIRSNLDSLTHWSWIPLLENKDLNAGLLYLAPGNSVSPNRRGANISILYNTLNEEGSNHDEQATIATQLYLNVFGKTRISCCNASLNDSTVTLAQSSTRILKPGEAFAENPVQTQVERLVTEKEASLLLGIRLLNS